MLPVSGFAASSACTVQGNKSFTVGFDVVGSNTYQDVHVTQGNKREETLWYNLQENSDSSYIFNEQSLDIGTQYQVLITHDNDSNLSQYYLREKTTPESGWLFKDQRYKDIKNGNLNVESLSGDITNLQCSDSNQPPIEPPIYSTDAQYEFGVVDCSSGACQITFEKTYQYTPVVFVMPTIATEDPDSHWPATLRVDGVTNSSAQVRYEGKYDDSWPYQNDTVMSEVSYLVIEPGIADFGGHTVVAGYLNTARYKSKSGSQVSEAVDFSTFGLQQSFVTNPVVLHQIQTSNNGDKWLTSGKTRTNQDRNSASLFLEASASRSEPYNAERIGFMATSAATNLSVGDYIVEFGRGTETASQGGDDSMADGCENSWVSTSLTRVDGIIANKQERAGGHGGWLRRCEIRDDAHVSFVVDEDFSNRGHIPEEVGHFAFEKVTSEVPDICPYFPAVAQAWLGASKSLLNFPIGSDGKVLGTANLQRAVGFGDLSDNYSSCDGGECSLNPELILRSPPPILDFDITGGDEVLGWTSTPIEVPDTSYNTLNIGNGGQYVMSASVYEIGKFVIGGGATVTFPSSTILKVNELEIGNDAKIIVEGDPLIIWAENGETLSARVNLLGSFNDLEAYIFSRDLILMQGSMKVLGAATANELRINGSAHLEYKNLGCGVPPPNKYTVSLSPATDIALTCETLDVQVQVLNSNGDLASDFSGTVTFEETGKSTQTLTPVGGVLDQLVALNSSIVMDKTVSAFITGERSETEVEGFYQFVPYRLRIDANPLEAIAGKPASIQIKPLECDAGGQPVTSPDYTGVRPLQLSSVSYQKPSEPVSKAVLSITNAYGEWIDTPQSGTTELATRFEVGTGNEVSAEAELIYPEAGEIAYNLSSEDCIEDENGDQTCKTYSGTHTVKSRPWTLAICDVYLEGLGTSSSGKGFVAAGENFDLSIRPVVWDEELDGSQEEQKISYEDFCSLDVTYNYFKPNSGTNPRSSNMKLSHKVVQELIFDGELQGTVEKADAHVSANAPEVLFNALKITEVGSFHIKASATGYDDILGGIDEGWREIGRFYPALFEVFETAWAYSHNGFTYMGQPFDGVEFKVEALNSDSEPTLNYAAGAYTLQAHFNIFEDVDPDLVRLTAPPMNSNGWELYENKAVGTFSYGSSNSCENGVCWEKASNFKPDGPYNVGLGSFNTSISVTGTSVDHPQPEDIDYVDGNQRLTKQPELRFGRLRLEDVGGAASGQPTVPLSVEYWDGAQFVTNTDDSETSFDGTHYCYKVISSEGDGGELSGRDIVNVGTSQQLKASQETSGREQIRFWLTLDSSEGTNGEATDCSGASNAIPWLRYNWDGEDEDEEDPSTLVTFGVYRGNDRIIFRGEPGLTGQ
ncbi:DUF6701 domain-containing protein [Vibrio astriarenae]|uniref:DUF6701 domain-containing protein n=1 Tax=Vibrio astriarenae TaxID=1481923 RepID=UPI003735D05E